MVGILVSFWDGQLSGAMLVSGRVIHRPCGTLNSGLQVHVSYFHLEGLNEHNWHRTRCMGCDRDQTDLKNLRISHHFATGTGLLI